MPHIRYLALTILATAVLLIPSGALAGFRVVPIKIYLDANTRTTVLKVTNDGDEKATVQVEAFEWGQDAQGKDVYLPTKELVFFPKITDIEKGEEKIIRVGYEGKMKEPVEKTYRLFLQELPVSKPGEVAVKMAIRMGLPVFIKPVKETRAKAIEGMELSGGDLMVRVSNSGNTHLIVTKILVKGFNEAGAETFARETSGWYVLAGKTGSYTVPISRDECLRSRSLKAQVEADSRATDKTIEISQAMCADKEAVADDVDEENPEGDKQ